MVKIVKQLAPYGINDSSMLEISGPMKHILNLYLIETGKQS